MNMLKWAEKEIELACKKEAPDRKEGEWDYGCACYESALKAYKSLLEDEHSGFSWSLTRDILIKLLDGRPLTPITEEDFKDAKEWMSKPELFNEGIKSHLQCPRMYSLFRKETFDGVITYTDNDRYYCIDINNSDYTYTGGGAADILDKACPITMPYNPSQNKYKIVCETFLVDKTMGDYDTKGYHYIITPDNDRIDVNRFFKEIKDGKPEIRSYISPDMEDENGTVIKGKVTECLFQPTKWVEISKEEFEKRRLERHGK